MAPIRSNVIADMEDSPFHSRIKKRCFGDATLAVLHSLLVSEDVKSSSRLRTCFERFMRSESPAILREVAEKTVAQVLYVLDFLVRAFALIDDFESCLALRYEALVLRENKSAVHQWLQVSHIEWANFAEDALNNGFYSIATKACENAVVCIQRSRDCDMEGVEVLDFSGDIQRINRLHYKSVLSSSSRSVQAEAMEYLKGKTIKRRKQQASTARETQSDACILFRENIKMRNARNLSERQKLKHNG